MSEQERKGGNFAVQEESLIRLPLVLQQVLNRLHRAGFSAYAVGGCVRDSLLGRIPKDWDVTTSAKPEEVAAVFSDAKVLPTGIRHGTVTLLTDEMPIEITTFRSEGSYSDHRRPDEVTFLEKPDQDLARRDFTINAMAYHSKEGLLDLFGGRAHLKQKIVCCVGDPIARFREDALRILRAMRFASELDFTIEEKTAKAMKECRNLLSAISPERIYAELVKLLCGAGAGRVLSLYGEVLLPVLPELEPMFDCKQNSPYHDKSVWEHTLWVIDALPGEKVLRLVALFHDMGKPALKTTDKGKAVFHQLQHIPGGIVTGQQQIKAGSAAHGAEIQNLVLPIWLITQVGSSKMLNGVHLCRIHHRLFVGRSQPQIKGGYSLLPHRILSGYIQSGLQFNMVNGKAGNLFHNIASFFLPYHTRKNTVLQLCIPVDFLLLCILQILL